MTIKVHVDPDFIGSSETGGIRRVSEGMLKHFGKFGVEHVQNVKDADVILAHGSMPTRDGNKPIININHGLYWSRQEWGESYLDVNERLVEAMQRAVAHTAPSEWVSKAIRRGGLFYPKVIYHGVDSDEFAPGENQGYVLWSKARADVVSDPQDMQKVAAMLPEVKFLTTIGQQTRNVSIMKRGPRNEAMPFNQMKKVIANAGVYLCTARETFGIGTLEAMACGVPVAGWDWGGQSEIIIQGVTGYLAYPGDYKGLAECIEMCIAHRNILSNNCIDDVKKRWGWEKRVEEYADLVKKVYHDHYKVRRPKVSILISAYNLDKYLPACLESVNRQTLRGYECIVVDDAQSKSTKDIVMSFREKNKKIKYKATPENLGLPGARNFGFEHSKGKYIRHLDADDWLADNALEVEVAALEKDLDAHIVYGHMEMVNEDGSRIFGKDGNVVRSGWPEESFSWFGQMAHLNQLPSCCMMRREVLERSGGYRDRMVRNEDAEFWCRVTSLGFRAKKFTQAVTYFHRHREDSKGAEEWAKDGKEPDWTAWFPWRMGASDFQSARDVLRKNAGLHPNAKLVPFGAQGKTTDPRFWYVHDYAYPVVSVIVTCGPMHEKHLLDALDSVQAQSYPDWECIVVNDTGKAWESDIMGAPFAKVVNMDGNQGVSAARNKGFEYAKGRFIVWMDADDYWLPWYLDRMVAYGEQNDGIIFSDLIQDTGDNLEVYRYPEFNEARLAIDMRYAGSSVLVPRYAAELVLESQGGWDTEIVGMEDWDYQIAVHDAGVCAYRIEDALFVYRVYSSTKREKDHARISEISAYLDEKWKKYRKEGVTMACGCGKKKIVKALPQSTMSSSGNFKSSESIAMEMGDEGSLVMVEYFGPNEQNFSIRSKLDPRVRYTFGNNRHKKRRTVFLKDAQRLAGQIGPNGKVLWQIVTGAKVEDMDPQAALGRQLKS